MKKILCMMLLCATMIGFSSCSKDDDAGFDYPMDTLYGTWEGTGIYYNGSWIDPTSSWIYSDLQFSITFYSNGKYYGEGFFGTGGGTYKASGNTITTYVDGKKYLTYKIKSLTSIKAEITMYDDTGDSLDLRVTKK